MSKTWMQLEQHLSVDANESGNLLLSLGQTAYKKLFIAIAGHGKTNLTDNVHIYVKAGDSQIDLASVAEVVYDAGGSACMLRIDFPIRGMHIVVSAGGTAINVSVYGGND